MVATLVNRLFPSYFVVNYNSPYGVHRQTVPTSRWTNGGGAFGQFLAWDASQADAETMCDAFVTAEAEFFPTTVHFTSWEIFDLATDTTPPLLVRAKNITIDGTVGTPGWYKGAQAVWSFKSDLGGDIFYDMLDVATLNSFDKITSATASADQITFIDLVTADTNGFAGRDNGQPNFFLQIAFGLNSKLRREYRMN